MSFILQRKHNECAIATGLFALRKIGERSSYQFVKLLLFNHFSFTYLKFLFSLYGYKTICLECDKDYLQNMNFEICISQIRCFIGYHYVCFIKKGNKFKVYNPSLGLIYKLGRKTLEKWTGFILIPYK